MFRIIGGLIRLTRYKEFIAFVIITTLLGSIAADATFGWRLILVLVANWLAVGFAFMINDVEDAEDDALNPKKINRNPVSCKDLSERNGYIASFIIAGLALIAYSFLGTVPLILRFCRWDFLGDVPLHDAGRAAIPPRVLHISSPYDLAGIDPFYIHDLLQPVW